MTDTATALPEIASVRKVFTADVVIHATAYVVASSEAEAIAALLTRPEYVEVGGQHIDHRPFDVLAEKNFSLSPVMTISRVDPPIFLEDC